MQALGWTLLWLYVFLTAGMPFWHTCSPRDHFASWQSLCPRPAAEEGRRPGAEIGEKTALPRHPCLACVWSRNTLTALWLPLAVLPGMAVARFAGSSSEGCPVPLFVPSFRTRAPPLG